MSTRLATWAVQLGLAVAAAFPSASVLATEAGVTPFKLGTFREGNREFPGLVLRDTRVVDIAAANVAFERDHRREARSGCLRT